MTTEETTGWKGLLKLGVADPATIRALPVPEEFSWGSPTYSQLFRVGKHLFDLWLEILLSEGPPVLSDPSKDVDEVFWDELAGRAGAYYAFCLGRILSSQDKSKRGLPPGFQLIHQRRLLERTRSQNAQNFQILAVIIANAYLGCMTSTYFARTFGRSPIPARLSRPFESLAVEYLEDVYDHGLKPLPPYQRFFCARALDMCVRQVRRTFKDLEIKDQSVKSGIYSSLRPDELNLLASRDAQVIKKYGEKAVERVYEQQLSILMQSFGFIVANARLGERRIDITCIWPDQDKYVFLLDAKSSKRPYSLPTSDERALGEYVDTTRRSLNVLPPLRFLMIVGHSPSATLEKRLQTLEAKIGLPVRFCPAEILSSLRESIPGPVPASAFLGAARNGNHILGESFAADVQHAYEEYAQGHTEFVRILMAYGEGTPQKPSGWEAR